MTRFKFAVWLKATVISPFRLLLICETSVIGGNNLIVQINNPSDYAKPNIKEIHCFRAVDFSLSKNLYIFENGVWGVAPRQVAGTPVPVFSPFPWERGQGDRDSKLEVCFQKQTFSTVCIHCFRAVDFLYNC